MTRSWANVPVAIPMEFEKIPYKELSLHIGNPSLDLKIEEALKNKTPMWIVNHAKGDYPAHPQLTSLLDRLEGESGEVCITIQAESTGYYDPGKISGSVETCYPPEGEDDRTVESVVHITEEAEIELSEDDCSLIETFCSAEIHAAELPEEEEDWE